MIMGGILQSLRQFLIYSFAPLLYNLGIILGVLVLVPLIGTSGLAWGVVLGAFLHCSLQIYGATHNGFRWKPTFNLTDKNTRLIGRLMLPRTLGLAVTQLNNVIITVLASTLPVGSVTIYNLANNLQGFPTGLIGIPFALAVFPVLSAAIANNDEQDFIKNISGALRQILFFIIPLTLIFLILRAQIVRVVLGSGNFDWTATITTANTLAFFSFGLFAQSLLPLLARGFYALSDTMTPFVIGIISELVSIIIAIVLIKPEIGIFHSTPWLQGVIGLAFASSLGVILNVVLLFIFLRRRLGNLEGQKLLTLSYKIAIAGLFMASVIQLSKYPLGNWLDLSHFSGILLQGLISGTMGLLVYAGICHVLKVEEFKHVYQSLKRKWLKIRTIPEIANQETI
jgi:putative peptidoglycan lipid II flippase